MTRTSLIQRPLDIINMNICCFVFRIVKEITNSMSKSYTRRARNLVQWTIPWTYIVQKGMLNTWWNPCTKLLEWGKVVNSFYCLLSIVINLSSVIFTAFIQRIISMNRSLLNTFFLYNVVDTIFIISSFYDKDWSFEVTYIIWKIHTAISISCLFKTVC